MKKKNTVDLQLLNDLIVWNIEIKVAVLFQRSGYLRNKPQNGFRSFRVNVQQTYVDCPFCPYPNLLGGSPMRLLTFFSKVQNYLAIFYGRPD